MWCTVSVLHPAQVWCFNKVTGIGVFKWCNITCQCIFMVLHCVLVQLIGVVTDISVVLLLLRHKTLYILDVIPQTSIYQRQYEA